MWAVEKGLESVIYRTLDFGVNLEDYDNDGWTAIMYAARRGNLTVVQRLLEAGADLAVSSNEDHFTPLHLAAGNGLIAICIALLKAGSDPGAKDSNGRTAETYFVDPKNVELFQHCVAATYPADGKTPAEVNQSRMKLGAEVSMNRAMEMINKSAKGQLQKMKEAEAEAAASAVVAAKLAKAAAAAALNQEPEVDTGPSNYPKQVDLAEELSEGSAHFSAPSHAPSVSHASFLAFSVGNLNNDVISGDPKSARSRQPSEGPSEGKIPDAPDSRPRGMDPRPAKDIVKVLSLDDLAKKGVEVKEYVRDFKLENTDSELYKDRTFAWKKKP
jgi:hypothetical protein